MHKDLNKRPSKDTINGPGGKKHMKIWSKFSFKKNKLEGIRVGQWVKPLASAQVRISRVLGLRPTWGSLLSG